MFTGAMQSMIENMLRETVQNLPPEIQEKIGQAFEFVGTVDARLAAMQSQLDRLERILTDGPVRNEPHQLGGPETGDRKQADGSAAFG